MFTDRIRQTLIASVIICLTSSLSYGQANSLRFRACTEDKCKLPGMPIRIVALGPDTLLALTPAKTGSGRQLQMILTHTLQPIAERKLSFDQTEGDIAVEDLFLHQGLPYILFSEQHRKTNGLNIGIQPIAPNSMEQGRATVLLKGTTSGELDNFGSAIGLHIEHTEHGYAITDLPMTNASYSFPNIDRRMRSRHRVIMTLDHGLALRWGGIMPSICHPCQVDVAMNGRNEAIVFAAVRPAKGSDQTASIQVYSFNGASHTLLESESLAEGREPGDILVQARLDGSILCSSALRDVSGTVGPGVFVGLFDPAAMNWAHHGSITIDAFRSAPKAVISICDMQVNPEGGALLLMKQEGRSETTEFIAGIYPFMIDPAGGIREGAKFNYKAYTGNNDPSILTLPMGPVLLANDTPERREKQEAGKGLLTLINMGIAIAVTFDPHSGNAEVTYIHGSEKKDEDSIMASGFWPIGEGKWATCASNNLKLRIAELSLP